MKEKIRENQLQSLVSMSLIEIEPNQINFVDQQKRIELEETEREKVRKSLDIQNFSLRLI